VTSPGTARGSRRVSATGAAALVRSGDWLDCGATLCRPDVFDEELTERTPELGDVRIRPL